MAVQSVSAPQENKSDLQWEAQPSKATDKAVLSVTLRAAPVVLGYGDVDSKNQIVLFQDLSCGMCKVAFDQILPALRVQLIDSGRARLVIRDMSLTSRESEMRLASALRCAHDQGRYFDLLGEVYSRHGKVTLEELAAVANAKGLDNKSFERCVKDEKYLPSVRADQELASQIGVKGTPTFFVNGSPLLGAFQSVSSFEELLQPSSKDSDSEPVSSSNTVEW